MKSLRALRSRLSLAVPLRRMSGGLSYFHNPGQESFKYATVGRVAAEAASLWPDRPAIHSLHQGLSLTFSEAIYRADKLAGGLVKLGLQPGDRVAYMGTSSLEYYLTILAAARAGLVLVNINPALRGTELEHCLVSSRASALLCDHSYKGQDFYGLVGELVPGLTQAAPRSRLSVPAVPSLHSLVVNSQDPLPGSWKLTDLMNESPEEVHKLESIIQPDDPCSILFSSGTSGRPKPVLLNHFTMINNAYFFGKEHGFSDKHHTLCLQVPMFHTFGTCVGMFNSLNHGCTLVIPSPTFSPAATIQAISELNCSIIYGTPTMYVDLCDKILKTREEDAKLREGLKSVEIIVCGGAVCTPQLFRLIADTLGCSNLKSAYGMTESSPILMMNSKEETFEQTVRTVGKVAPHTEVKVVDEAGKMVPFGVAGEAWFRSYSVMMGYFGDEQKTKEAITQCRWIKTGDVFILQEDGYGQVVGRMKDVIIRGGENIFPAEVEELLEGHPDVLEAQVYGAPDERMGEEVCASLILQSGSQLTEDQLRQYCKSKIAHFKIPRYILFVDSFPKTASGKIQKYVLRREITEELKRRSQKG